MKVISKKTLWKFYLSILILNLYLINLSIYNILWTQPIEVINEKNHGIPFSQRKIRQNHNKIEDKERRVAFSFPLKSRILGWSSNFTAIVFWLFLRICGKLLDLWGQAAASYSIKKEIK